MFKKSILTALLVMVTAAAAHAEKNTVDTKIKKVHSRRRRRRQPEQHRFRLLNNLMTYWARASRRSILMSISRSKERFQHRASALIAGTAQLGPMSREMKSSEIEEFEKKHGYKPTKIGVALDSLAVFVNKDNPIKSLSLDKVDAIFSKTHKRAVPMSPPGNSWV